MWTFRTLDYQYNVIPTYLYMCIIKGLNPLTPCTTGYCQWSTYITHLCTWGVNIADFVLAMPHPTYLGMVKLYIALCPLTPWPLPVLYPTHGYSVLIVLKLTLVTYEWVLCLYPLATTAHLCCGWRGHVQCVLIKADHKLDAHKQLGNELGSCMSWWIRSGSAEPSTKWE